MSPYFFCLNLDTEHISNIETIKNYDLGADMRLLILIQWSQQEKKTHSWLANKICVNGGYYEFYRICLWEYRGFGFYR